MNVVFPATGHIVFGCSLAYASLSSYISYVFDACSFGKYYFGEFAH